MKSLKVQPWSIIVPLIYYDPILPSILHRCMVADSRKQSEVLQQCCCWNPHLLECNTVLLGKWFPMFWRIILPSSSGPSSPRRIPAQKKLYVCKVWLVWVVCMARQGAESIGMVVEEGLLFWSSLYMPWKLDHWSWGHHVPSKCQ